MQRQRYLVFKFVGNIIEVYSVCAVNVEAAVLDTRIVLPTYHIYCNTDITNKGVFALELESIRQEPTIISEVAKAFDGVATDKLN